MGGQKVVFRDCKLSCELQGFVSRSIYNINLLQWIPLGLADSRNNFIFKELFKRFLLYHQILMSILFYA